MSNHISLTIPRDDDKALIAGATMLLTLAGKVPEMELDDTVGEITTATTTPPPKKETATLEDGGTGVPARTTTTPPPKTTTPPPAKDTDVKLGKNGLPWDARIHAGTKAFTADGNWRYRQGVDRAVLVPQVEAELRTLMETTVDTAETKTTTPPPAKTTPPPAVDTDGPTTFPEFLKAVSGLIGAGKTTMVVVNEVLNRPEFGAASIQLVNSVPEKIPAIWAALVASCE